MDVPITITAPNSAVPYTARPRKTALDEKSAAAGVIIVTKEGTALFLKRNERDGDEMGGMWCWPGGSLESGEDATTAAIRETREETGHIVDGPIHELDNRELNGVNFTTFETMVGNEFIPELNDEHVGWAWAPLDDPPQPLHPGCRATLDMAAGMAEDTAANQATESELRSTIKYPPEKGNGTRAINVAMKNGGAGKTLTTPEKTKKFVVTGRTEDSADFKESEHPRAPDGKFGSGGSSSSNTKKNLEYPTAPSGTRYTEIGDTPISYMTPDEFLKSARPLDVDDSSRENIDDLKNHIKSGKKLDPLALYADGKEDGRHRAIAAKELGITKVPVVNYRKQEKSETKSSGFVASYDDKPALKMSEMKKVGKQLGSNPGGQYEDKSGKKYYIKQGKSKDHADNELMAGALYNLAGVQTQKYRKVDGGGHIATEWQTFDKSNAKDFTPAETKAAQDDFAVHAWLANWDAAGLDYDNQAIINGKPASIDLGGALKYRAQGGPKGNAFGTEVGEWNTLRDKNTNPQNAKLFGGMTDEQLKKSARKVTDIPNDTIRETVHNMGGDDAMVDKLIARKKDIAKRADVIASDYSLSGAITSALQTAVSQITHVSDQHMDDQIEYIVNNFASIAGIAKSRARQLLLSAINRKKYANDIAQDVAIILSSHAIVCAHRSR